MWKPSPSVYIHVLLYLSRRTDVNIGSVCLAGMGTERRCSVAPVFQEAQTCWRCWLRIRIVTFLIVVNRYLTEATQEKGIQGWHSREVVTAEWLADMMVDAQSGWVRKQEEECWAELPSHFLHPRTKPRGWPSSCAGQVLTISSSGSGLQMPKMYPTLTAGEPPQPQGEWLLTFVTTVFLHLA